MAMSPEQVNALIEVHRKNATLEAELSQARHHIKLLEEANWYMLRQLSQPQTESHGQTGYDRDRRPRDQPEPPNARFGNLSIRHQAPSSDEDKYYSPQDARAGPYGGFPPRRDPFGPPSGPRAHGGPPFRGPGRGYNDRDAPGPEMPRGLDYEEKSATAPGAPILRRVQPVDYSDMSYQGQNKRAPNLLDRDESAEVVAKQPEVKEEAKSVASSDSTVESGEIIEPKNEMDQSRHAPAPFTPITNRHLGPVEATTLDGKEEQKHPASVGSDSDSDSVESERAKRRRHADQILASMEPSKDSVELPY